MNDLKFKFDSELSLGQNFIIWNDLDANERDTYNEPKLERLEAIKLFSQIHAVSAVDVQDSLAVESTRFSFKLES
jgi:hypothetical protein